jgi:hypothetical protein
MRVLGSREVVVLAAAANLHEWIKQRQQGAA